MDQAIIFESKMKNAYRLISKISTIKTITSVIDLNGINNMLNKLSEDTHNEVYNTTNRTDISISQIRMFNEQTYSNACTELNKIINGLENYLTYAGTVEKCKIIESVTSKDIDINMLNDLVEVVKKCISNIRSSDTVYYISEKSVVEQLYQIEFKLIKLEFAYKQKSELLEYSKNYEIDSSYLSEIVEKELSTLEDTSFADEIFLKYNATDFIMKYLDEDLIYNLSLYKDKEELKKEVLDKIAELSKEYNDNSREIEKLNEKANAIITTYSKEKNRLSKLKKNKRKDIAKWTISILTTLSIVISALIGIGRVKSYKYNITTYSTLTNKEIFDEKYINFYNKPARNTYVFAYNPYQLDEDGKFYERDYTKFYLKDDTNYEEIQNHLSYEYLDDNYNSYSKKDNAKIYKDDMTEEDFYNEVIYEVVNMEKVPDDFIYEYDFGLMFFVFLIECAVLIILESASDTSAYTTNTYTYTYTSNTFTYIGIINSICNYMKGKKDPSKYGWPSEEELEENKEKLKELLNNKEELLKRITYLLSTNEELKKKYEELLKRPEYKKLFNKYENIIISDINTDKNKLLQKTL